MTNQKLKMMLLIIDSKHSQKQQNKKSNVVVKEELLKSIKESYDEHDPNLGENVRKLEDTITAIR